MRPASAALAAILTLATLQAQEVDWPANGRDASGEQFVAIAVGGGGAWGAGDSVVAFRLRT